MRFGDDVFFLLLFSRPSTLASSARARSRLLLVRKRKGDDAVPIFGVRKEDDDDDDEEEEEEEGERARAPEEAMEEERSIIIRGALFVSRTFRARSVGFCKALPEKWRIGKSSSLSRASSQKIQKEISN